MIDWKRARLWLVDMDGTVLDLAYDNWFWQHCVPAKYAAEHGLTPSDALRQLQPKFDAVTGTLDWYCLEYWSRTLGLDIIGLKAESRQRITALPAALTVVEQARQSGIQAGLLTNAHPETLRIKHEQTGVCDHFDWAISSAELGFPKEHPGFWAALSNRLDDFDPTQALMIDDSLAVLQAARDAGIGQTLAIAQPDSGSQVRDLPDEPWVIDRLENLQLPAVKPD